MATSRFRWLIACIALAAVLVTSRGAFSVGLLVDEETGRLLVELVKVSQEYDLYNDRCRGNAASTKTKGSNRLFIAKYQLTVNQVISRYIGEDDRAEKAAIEEAFLGRIRQMGGCRTSKKQGLQKELDERYRRMFEQISNLP
ncbi:MAG: hypothetical protein GY703_00335 [Gammaproteobacteria bacterium]|nr:hypothetical protein [Gammaproteobacteria bacterium]